MLSTTEPGKIFQSREEAKAAAQRDCAELIAESRVRDGALPPGSVMVEMMNIFWRIYRNAIAGEDFMQTLNRAGLTIHGTERH